MIALLCVVVAIALLGGLGYLAAALIMAGALAAMIAIWIVTLALIFLRLALEAFCLPLTILRSLRR